MVSLEEASIGGVSLVLGEFLMLVLEQLCGQPTSRTEVDIYMRDAVLAGLVQPLQAFGELHLWEGQRQEPRLGRNEREGRLLTRVHDKQVLMVNGLFIKRFSNQ